MKLTSFIALFPLSLIGVEAMGPGGKMPYQGDFALGDFRALLNSESNGQCCPLV